MRISQLRTPCFLIDRPALVRNAGRMQETARRLGVRLRPHVKTHKCVEAARMQTAGGFHGITVSTLAEAEHFKSHGFDDITYAFPISRDKLDEAASISQGIRLSLLVDHPDQVDALERWGQSGGAKWRVLLEIDCGYGRSGVEPRGGKALDLARRISASPGLHFEGILTHAGHSYDARSERESSEIARQEAESVSSVAQELERTQIPCPSVSIGSTPSMSHAPRKTGRVTEIRPGNYLLFDKFQADIGSCRLQDCAAAVLTTIVSHYPERGEMLIDAGALALSKDRGARQDAAAIQLGGGEYVFGAVPEDDALQVARLSQEHGMIKVAESQAFDRHPIGSKIEIIPNHACLAAAGYSEYHIVENGRVVDRWHPAKGWRLPASDAESAAQARG